MVEGERTAEGVEVTAAPKKRNTRAGRVPEGRAPEEGEKRKKKKRDQVPDLVRGGDEELTTPVAVVGPGRQGQGC